MAILIIAGSAHHRRPSEAARLTLAVDSLDEAIDTLKTQGAKQLEPMQVTRAGRKTRFQHPDGLTVECPENSAAGDEK